MKTFSIKKEEIKKKWVLIDANNAVLGRLAVISANILRGKNGFRKGGSVIKSVKEFLDTGKVEKIEASKIKNLVVTDSIEATPMVKQCSKIRLVATAPMLAQAMLNIAQGSSVSSLFNDDTLGPIYEAFYPE